MSMAVCVFFVIVVNLFVIGNYSRFSEEGKKIELDAETSSLP